MSNIEDRMNQEWITLNAIRGTVKIASKGDMSKSTYDNAFGLGAVLYPELLGPENSILRRERESDTTREYRQKADLMSLKNGTHITALELVIKDMEEIDSLILIAKKNNDDQKRTDQLKKKIALLQKARLELEIKSHSENQLIFRDAYNVERNIPELSKGHGYRDFELPDGNNLRLRVLHPDRPEHITGADIIYERHDKKSGKISIVVVQYKIWEDKKLYVSDERMQAQIQKMKKFTCENNICRHKGINDFYRFPCCAGFLRPTDKLQKADQKFISTGEHIPICKINDFKSKGVKGGEILEYEKIKEVSLSAELFEELFNRGKIGSRELSRSELEKLYKDSYVIDKSDTVVIYAQEF
ncbi:hypothetical protein LF929_007270 [Dickeya oryzae]|uniref:Uncharacterized protein n=1 Tax=Dickeya oryzae TaxID=1240404 RepID=A0AB39IUV4_9GAMM|nr:hypothetical protein [Dickeya oryzae]MCA6991748.1 hypothetical protein [Dickeya oryzae]